MSQFMFLIIAAVSFNLMFSFNNVEDEISNQNTEPSHCFDENNIRTITRCGVDTNICGQRYVGKFNLSEESKSMISEYCYEIGEEITFKNFFNDTKRTFVVTKKFYGYTKYKTKTIERCKDDKNKKISACADIQMVNVELECKEVNLKFHLELINFIYAVFTPKHDKFAEKLKIGRKNKRGKIIPDLEVFLNPETVKFPVPLDQKVDIQKSPTSGKIINKVYSNNWTQEQNRIKLHYSTSNGLAMFTDEEGSTWVRK